MTRRASRFRFELTAQALLAITLLLTIHGCGGSTEPPANPASTDTTIAEPRGDEARTLPIPGAELPRGNQAGGSAGIVWTVPDGWVEETPASSMRKNQYRVSGESGVAECIVFYFGPGQGGDPLANARRWAGQFSQPDGSASLEHMRVSELSTARLPVQIVEVTGTYDGGMTMTNQPAQKQTEHMLLGGIAQGPDAPWFFKFTGPETLVRANYDAFVEMMESIRTDG